MIVRLRTLACLGALALPLAACGETAFQDLMDVGKYSPDESKVARGQALTVPPDLQLRPPGSAAAAAAPQPAPQAVPGQPLATTAPQYGAAPTTPAQPTPYNAATATAPAQSAATAPRPITPTQPGTATTAATTPGAAPAQPDDVYARYGISRTNPDGTKKTQSQLNAELRKVALARKRQKNPNYGTIFNMGNIWRDGAF